jgi:hypothetical protein
VHLRRVAAALGRCAGVLVCVDARDACGNVSALHLGCQTSSCCCSACRSLAAFTRCLQSLCCYCSLLLLLSLSFLLLLLLLLCTQRLFARA